MGREGERETETAESGRATGTKSLRRHSHISGNPTLKTPRPPRRRRKHHRKPFSGNLYFLLPPCPLFSALLPMTPSPAPAAARAGYPTASAIHQTSSERTPPKKKKKLPTYTRMRKGMLPKFDDAGKLINSEVDLLNLDMKERKVLVDRIMRRVEEANELFLKRLRDQFNQVGVDLPKIEVRFENLAVESVSTVASRVLPTLLNATVNTLRGAFLAYELLLKGS